MIRIILIAWLAVFAVTMNAAEKPNVLVIYVDDVGYNDIGCCGAKDPATNPLFPFLIGAPSGILSEGEKANS